MKYNDNGEWKDIQVKVANAVKNEYGTSQSDCYSQKYINDNTYTQDYLDDHTINVGVNDTDFRVNFIKGKNLCDKTNLYELNVFINENGMTSNDDAKTLWIPITGGKTYTISNSQAIARFRLCTTQSIPQIGTTTSNYVYGDGETSLSITTSVSARYLLVYYYLSGTETRTRQSILDALQIEEGSSATSYEPYVDRAITVDGETIYNQDLQNYSTGEKLIGTWIDGKPLYRKVFTNLGSINANSYIEVNTGITNLSDVINVSGNIYRGELSMWYPIINPWLDIRFDKTTGKVRLESINQYVNFSSGGTIILEYTKTSGGQE